MPEHAAGTRAQWLRVDEQNPGCTGCSFVADHFDGVIPHLNGHDVTLGGAEYNFRHVDQVGPQREGMSAFVLQDGVVHHTYSTYARGVEQLMGTFGYLDVAPLGCNDDPSGWWRRHDEYETREKEARQ